jgi:hypothetical protein
MILSSTPPNRRGQVPPHAQHPPNPSNDDDDEEEGAITPERPSGPESIRTTVSSSPASHSLAPSNSYSYPPHPPTIRSTSPALASLPPASSHGGPLLPHPHSHHSRPPKPSANYPLPPATFQKIEAHREDIERFHRNSSIVPPPPPMGRRGGGGRDGRDSRDSRDARDGRDSRDGRDPWKFDPGYDSRHYSHERSESDKRWPPPPSYHHRSSVPQDHRDYRDHGRPPRMVRREWEREKEISISKSFDHYSPPRNPAPRREAAPSPPNLKLERRFDQYPGTSANGSLPPPKPLPSHLNESKSIHPPPPPPSSGLVPTPPPTPLPAPVLPSPPPSPPPISSMKSSSTKSTKPPPIPLESIQETSIFEPRCFSAKILIEKERDGQEVESVDSPSLTLSSSSISTPLAPSIFPLDYMVKVRGGDWKLISDPSLEGSKQFPPAVGRIYRINGKLPQENYNDLIVEDPRLKSIATPSSPLAPIDLPVVSYEPRCKLLVKFLGEKEKATEDRLNEEFEKYGKLEEDTKILCVAITGTTPLVLASVSYDTFSHAKAALAAIHKKVVFGARAHAVLDPTGHISITSFEKYTYYAKLAQDTKSSNQFANGTGGQTMDDMEVDDDMEIDGESELAKATSAASNLAATTVPYLMPPYPGSAWGYPPSYMSAWSSAGLAHPELVMQTQIPAIGFRNLSVDDRIRAELTEFLSPWQPKSVCNPFFFSSRLSLLFLMFLFRKGQIQR